MKIVFEKGKIYKIRHSCLRVGQECSGFKVIDNCIIFSPKIDVLIEGDCNNLPCSFLISFDKKLILNETTGYHNDCKVEKVTLKDIEGLLTIFKINGKLYDLASMLKNTKYRYNRKLDKIVEL